VASEATCYIVDTNVLSNRGDADSDPNVARWLRRHAGAIRVSVVTVAEMWRGLILLEARVAATAGRAARARLSAALRSRRGWYDMVLDRFDDRIEPIDLVVAQKWAEVSVRFPSLRDGDKAIAATAMARGFGVATRNLGDFRHAGLKAVNPFDPGTWDEDWDDDPVSALSRR
jgi:predicted nucleic acid-binding protein